MRVLIVGVGSRGDVAPYVGLGRRLLERGWQVAIATHDRFAVMVREAGLEWRRLSGDVQEMIRSRMQHDSEAAWRQTLTDFTTEMGDDIADAAQLGADIVLTPFGQAPMCSLVAAALGVPCGWASTSRRPCRPPSSRCLVPHRPPRTPPWTTAAAGQQLIDRGRAIYADVLPHLGRRLGLQHYAHQTLWERLASSETPTPICHGYSAALVPRPADWPDNVEVVGYWWPTAPPSWQPSAELTDFLIARIAAGVRRFRQHGGRAR